LQLKDLKSNKNITFTRRKNVWKKEKL
jgi:hypothetical protein